MGGTSWSSPSFPGYESVGTLNVQESIVAVGQKGKACVACKQRSGVRILSSPIYRWCDLGSYESLCSVKQGFGIPPHRLTGRCRWEKVHRRSFSTLHSADWCCLCWCWGSRSPAMAKSQLVPGSGGGRPWVWLEHRYHHCSSVGTPNPEGGSQDQSRRSSRLYFSISTCLIGQVQD